MITREVENIIRGRIGKGKAILLMGPRQVGKTTLLRNLASRRKQVLWLNADEPDIQETLSKATSTRLRSLFGKATLVVIDEAQRVPNIGLKLKLITDQIPEVQVIATGSSSFELGNTVNEPLTGRKWEYHLYPLSFGEMVDHHGLLEEKRLLPVRMVYGYYPDVVNHPGEATERLKLLADSYLFKDILAWDNIRKTDMLVKLLQALAFQLGHQVSYHELGQITGVDPKTVERYILLMEKAFIVFRVGSFSRNLRNELTNSRKIYFWDNGVRNAVIANFNPVELRQDTGALWENFVISERLKLLHYRQRYTNTWFWRTHAQQEIDWIEERNGKLAAYEIKWNEKRRTRITKTFTEAYPKATTEVITPATIEDFLR